MKTKKQENKNDATPKRSPELAKKRSLFKSSTQYKIYVKQ